MDESILRNLDTQHRMLSDVERDLDALSAGDEAPPPDIEVPGGQLSYEALTESNDRLRAERGWTDIDLDAALTTEQRERFMQWQTRQRILWDVNDLLIVGFAAVIGAAAAWFDMDLDKTVAEALGELKHTELLRGWEQDATHLPIDYTGPDFGGPAHRLRSPGHDPARLLEALRQIRDREFRGTRWTYGIHEEVPVSRPDFREVDSRAEALILWLKHLATDLVTPMSLPLPGMTFLYELDNRAIRKLANDLYGDARLNMRSGMLTPSLSVLSTEVIIRTHVRARAYQRDGTLKLTPADRVLQTELLLAAHSLVGAASIGKIVTRWVFAEEGPLAIRHLNFLVMLRIGCLAVSVVGDEVGRRSSAAPTWEELLDGCVQPWQLESAGYVERTAAQLSASGEDWPLKVG